MSSPRPARVAIVGRQNVGKSTLANRLFGRRETIAHESPGVTRDRIELETSWRGRTFGLVDTGGFAHRADGIEQLVATQAERAADEADVVVLVVDGHTGIQEEDAMLARRLRRGQVPVLLVVNKVDAEREELDVGAFYALGLGEPLPVSALHGRSSGDLLDRIVDLLPPRDAFDETGRDMDLEPRFALVGRPNVGKSSLFNRLVGEERSVVFEEAGTTRDAVDALVEWPDGPVRFVDTAGLRRSSRQRGVDYYSSLRTQQAIERSHVAALVIDADDGLTSEDKRIAARVMEFGRGLLIVANKWDLVEDKDQTFRRLTELVGPFAHAQVVRTSAVRGSGTRRLPPALLTVHERWTFRASTSKVNEVLQAAQQERPAPRGVGTFRYATQVSSGPPSFVVFGGKVPNPTYRRYLENSLRSRFELAGVPVKLTFRPKRRSS
ncbi:MAG: ribosome biogenesis GTPase Der [Actinomycetota bacterium]